MSDERREQAKRIADSLGRRGGVFGWLKRLANRSRLSTARAWTDELYFRIRLADEWPPRDPAAAQERMLDGLLQSTLWKRTGPRTFQCSSDGHARTMELPMPFDIVEFFRRATRAEMDVLFKDDDAALVPQLHEAAQEQLDVRLRGDGLSPAR